MTSDERWRRLKEYIEAEIKGGVMSERYTTDDLVWILEEFGNKAVPLFHMETEAIIGRLRKADKIVKEASRIGNYLCLWDDPEFDALRELLDKYEEE